MRCGVYVHIPFCRSKCGYCDFKSYSDLEHLYQSYVEAVQKESRAVFERFPGTEIETVYFGGGTPTLLDPADLTCILETLRDEGIMVKDAEVTIEANPETLSEHKCELLLDSGFNRISIGVQSFDDRILETLDRDCRAATSRASIIHAKQAGFNNINIDLMFGIEGQSIADWKETLHETLSYDLQHVSTYCLTVPPKGRIKAANEAYQTEMMLMADEMLTGQFEHYEISNFSLRGYECRHNLIYWRNEDYVGLGSSAHSHAGRIRWWNANQPKKYVELIDLGECAVVGQEDTSLKDEIADTVYMGFRLTDGIDLRVFRQRFGIDFRESFASEIDRAAKLGMINVNPENICLSRQGRLFADAVAVDFV